MDATTDMKRLFLLASVLVTAAALATQAGQFPPIVNTQKPKDRPPTPEEALRALTVPPGFQVTLFAGDPDVQQPIAMAIDDRGRVWVAECYTYAAGSYDKSWDPRHRDRILIFEDNDHDGRFDKRTIFWDNAQNLTSVALGFGGVWALCAPHLLFIPDRNGDDVPDGPPEPVLDGFAVMGAGHNIVSGLVWGPDGWLYGRHGILATSHVGRPGTPPAERVKLNCGIWRYHPTRKVFEAVAHGTTNPWGLDYDDHGQFFFTNSVNGHLWHLIPGAHYKRMYGEDLNPHVYGLIDLHADHQHWDATKSWTDSRDAKGEHGKRGGGHAHCGGMIYLGDNWPQKYRNTIFMGNVHGRRINNDLLVRHGSGYVGKHGDDFLFSSNPWFRATDLKYGPDGGVFISDWTDIGECHDHDGVHRTSGRIYKVTFGKALRPAIADVGKLADADLIDLQLHENDFYGRAARRLLQERAATRNMRHVHATLQEMFKQQPDVSRKLRMLWALSVTGGAVDETSLFVHASEHIRAWGVRQLVEHGGELGRAQLRSLIDHATLERSAFVRLSYASALQRLPLDQRWRLARTLVRQAEDADDHNLPLMIWYGIEPVAAELGDEAVVLAQETRIPLIRRYVARRLTERLTAGDAKPLTTLVRMTETAAPAFQRDVVEGMHDALRGWRKAKPPSSWAEAYKTLALSADKTVLTLARDLAVVFGDGRALAELWKLTQNSSAEPDARRAALRVLIDARPDGLVSVLHRLAGDRATVGVAVRGLAAHDHPETPAVILRNLHLLRPEDRPEAINTLVARPAYARALLDAVARDKALRSEISAYHARQIHNLGDAKLNARLAEVWGEIRTTPAEKKELIARYRKLLTPARLKKADPSNGRLMYNQVCATCHVLYGQGQALGPDITGADRGNLDYLLENIVDPSAVVPADFRVSVVTLKNGRVLTGVVGEETKALLVQTQTERIRVERGEIDEVHRTPASFMPDGLLTPLGDAQVIDLFAYLMLNRQVPLPDASRK